MLFRDSSPKSEVITPERRDVRQLAEWLMFGVGAPALLSKGSVEPKFVSTFGPDMGAVILGTELPSGVSLEAVLPPGIHAQADGMVTKAVVPSSQITLSSAEYAWQPLLPARR